MRRTVTPPVLALLGSLVGFNYIGDGAEAAAAELHLDLWTQTPANNSYHATADVDIDPGIEVISGILDLSAHNADPVYLRAIRFHLVVDGGTLGTYYLAPGQVRGDGTIAPLETKSWSYDLSQIMVADSSAPGGHRFIDFVGIINDLTQMSVPVSAEAWVTTAASGAWISASLHLQVEQRIVDTDGDGILDDVDVCPFEDATGFDADTDGCIDTLSGLEQIISALPDIGDGIRNSLLMKVASAAKLAERERYVPAGNVLKAFINEVNAGHGKHIEASVADLLVDYAENVAARLALSGG